MPRIRELLTAFRRMPPTVIAERISWPFSIRTSSDRVAELRPAYLPADPASRTAYALRPNPTTTARSASDRAGRMNHLAETQPSVAAGQPGDAAFASRPCGRAGSSARPS